MLVPEFWRAVWRRSQPASGARSVVAKAPSAARRCTRRAYAGRSPRLGAVETYCFA